MNRLSRLGILIITLWAAAVSTSSAGEPQSESPRTNSTSSGELTLELPKTTIWQNGIGEGFRPTVQTISFEVGADSGFAAFGSRQAHDLALVSLSYGHMLGHVVGEGHWYRGNWELRAELFGGAQFSPSTDWLVGLTPHLRYNFATGTRWVPFLDAGAGVTATGIGPPDLSNTFEFNLQGSVGTHWFLRDDLALTAEARYLHLSCAGISHPNLGLNSVVGMVGVTWFL